MAKIKKIKGLGDVIATITNAVGIEQCEGCEKRQHQLNKLVNFGYEEPTKEEKEVLKKFFSVENRDEITKDEQDVILPIYFRTHKVTPFVPCNNCSGVWKMIIGKLSKLEY
jgi:hypothetical protein